MLSSYFLLLATAMMTVLMVVMATQKMLANTVFNN